MSSSIIHPDIEPGVIDNNMLINSVLKQGPTGEAGRLYAEEGVKLDQVEALRLEFLQIMQIDHLWMMTNLKKLTLTHNHIEKIENLDRLVNLKELDISFNDIKKIENLDNLENIEVLILNNNKIKDIENMDHLHKLVILSLAGNLIVDYNEVIYLRRFSALQSLSFKDNPCCDDPQCNDFLKAALPKVTYIDFVLVTDNEREQSIQAFQSLIQRLDEEDLIREEQKVQKEVRDAQVRFYTMSFVEYLSGPELFEKMFTEDKDGTILLKAKKELQLLHDEYKVFYVQRMQELVEFGQQQYSVREIEVTMFQEVIHNARKICSDKSKHLVSQYMLDKQQSFDMMTTIMNSLENKTVTTAEAEPTLNEVKNNFASILKELKYELMKEEMNLFELCEETRIQFVENLKELANKMIEATRAAFGQWREREGSWSSKQGEVLSQTMEQLAVSYSNIPDLAELLSDRDILMDAVAQSLENHVLFIDQREDHVINRVTRWMEDLSNATNTEEIKRNRSRVLEIIEFEESQRKEWLNLQNDLFPDASSLVLITNA